VKSTISRPNEILVTFIASTLLGELCIDPASLKPRANIANLLDFAQDRCKRPWQTAHSLKPKVGELQMDWLRSEDLKEEKSVTAPMAIIAVEQPIAPRRCRAAQSVPLRMRRMNSEGPTQTLLIGR
jgi:hypothetical protein